ncbi:MAG TPA: TolC family protein [Thermoanaerobaculaceae bacterium]|nr:TolC family protein [Thermoanaerobaculaceae bacterium]HRS16291.1 TolC family protein [Thermoanaerobaculaceae bacterium]
MKRRDSTRRAAAVAAGLALAAAAASAEAPTPAAPVEILVEEALRDSPSLEALRERVAAARELVRPAGALPPPMFELMLQNERFDRLTVGESGMSMVGPEVRQHLPWPRARAARRAAAELDVRSREAELELARRELVKAVRQTAAALWSVGQRHELLAHAAELQQLLAATVAALYGTGHDEQAAVVRARLEGTRLARQQLELEGTREGLQAALARLLGQPPGLAPGRIAALPTAALPPPPWGEAAVTSSPLVTARRLAVAQAEREEELARLALRPGLTVGAGLGYRGDLDPVVSLRFGLELPVWRRGAQEPALRAASHAAAAARAELRQAELDVAAEAARLEAEWRRARSVAALVESTLLPQTSAAVDAARSAYLGERGELSMVVEALRLWLEARVELVELQALTAAIEAEVLALVGEVPASPDRGSPVQTGGAQ